MVCKFCNKQISNDSQVCKFCGGVVYEPQEQPVNVLHDYNYRYQKRNSSNILLILVICICSMLLVTAVALMFMIKNPKSDDKTNDINVETNIISSDSEEEPYKVFNRYQTFSPSYTYKSMPDINYSVPADDDECFEMQDFITKYNELWIELVNNKDESILAYVRYGTPSYRDVVNYKAKVITEEFELFEVNDVRKYGNCYYIWVHERIAEYSSSSVKHKEYHWIYKVAKDSNGYYVENYTKDPHYN